MTMRVRPVDPDELDAEGAELYKAIAGSRDDIVDGPFRVWLRTNPELAARMNDVGAVLRGAGRLDKRLFEIAVLSVARFWDAQYQWAAHVPIALECGLARKTIEGIGRGILPSSAPSDEQAVFELSVSLLENKKVADEIYDRVLALIGFENLAELVTTIAQYSMAAIVTNGFEIELPSGGPELPGRG